jgi:hypothetical protein
MWGTTRVRLLGDRAVVASCSSLLLAEPFNDARLKAQLPDWHTNATGSDAYNGGPSEWRAFDQGLPGAEFPH